MGRFVYAMNVSLDLRIEQVPGDNGAGEWLRIEEELHSAWNAQARESAARRSAGVATPRRGSAITLNISEAPGPADITACRGVLTV